MTAREELINDLIAFADLLRRRPDMPVGESTYAHIQLTVTDGDEAARVAEVHRIAALLGEEAERSPYGVTTRLESGRVTYTVHAGTDDGMAAWLAEQSYRGVVQPESVGAR